MKPLVILILCLVVLSAFGENFKGLEVGGLPFFFGAGSISMTTHALNQATDAAQWIWEMPAADTISSVGFCIATVTGTPVAHRVSLQGVTAAGGVADGSILNSGAAHADFTPTVAGCAEYALDSPTALTRGQLVAVVVEPTGTPDASNYMTLNIASNVLGSYVLLPYYVTVEAGTPTKSGAVPAFWLVGSSSVYGVPIASNYTATISSDSSPDEVGLVFSLPANACSTYQVVGVRAGIRAPAAGKTVAMSLYDGTTAVQSITVDTDQIATNAAARYAIALYFDEATLATLTCGATYRVALAPQQTGVSLGITGMNANSAADLAAWPGGASWYFAARTDGGAWADVYTRRPQMSLIIADITPPAGGGGTRSYATVH